MICLVIAYRHWTNKNCLAWAKEYFQNSLTKISVEDGSNSVSIKNLSSCEGDVDVSQRKGKIITLFDVKLVLDIQGLPISNQRSLTDLGATKEDESVCGTITVPEVAHDTEEDEYVVNPPAVFARYIESQFDVDIFSETSSKSVLRALIRNKLVPQIRQALSKFSGELIATHGKDVYNPSLNSTPANSGTATPALSKPSTPAPVQAPKPKGIRTTTLTEDIEFTTTAKDLYDVFIHPQKLAAWTRSQPTVDPKVGGKVVLFGGNVKGEFLVLEEGKKIEQTWRLPQWTEGTIPRTTHFSHTSQGTIVR